MEEIKLWKLACGPAERPKAVAVEKVAETTTEQLLEDVFASAPDLLLPNLLLIGRQTETAGGPLDLLGVDEDGHLVVFELKRGNLTRDAVAQAIDYGSYLASLEPKDLCRHIHENSGRGGTERIEDFAQWYESRFQRPVADIGRPRVVLVGLGADERTKRMVAFLAQSELDISLITFHGFRQGNETLLARQVEVQSQSPGEQLKSTKLGNQSKLDALLISLGIRDYYSALVTALKQGLPDSAYQWPNPTGYTFYLPEASATGGQTNRAYLALFAPEQRKGAIQLYFQARAIEAAGKEHAQRAAEMMGSKFTLKPNGWGEVWIDGHKPSTDHAEVLKSLGQAIASGWKAKVQNQAKAEAVGSGGGS